MEEFLKVYGPFLLLALFLIYLIAVNVYRAKKYNKEAQALIDSLKTGDYVKTYSGIYGSVVKVNEKTLKSGAVERMVKLQLDDNSYLTIDANAIYAVINELKPKPVKKVAAKKTTTKKTTTKKAETKKEVKPSSTKTQK